MSNTIDPSILEDWMGEPLSEEHRNELEQINLQKIEIKNLFDEWIGELEGYSFRYERFWDDFDYAKESKDNRSMMMWLRSAFEVGYYASESKINGETK